MLLVGVESSRPHQQRRTLAVKTRRRHTGQQGTRRQYQTKRGHDPSGQDRNGITIYFPTNYYSTAEAYIPWIGLCAGAVSALEQSLLSFTFLGGGERR